VLERGLAYDGRLCRLTATISDRPGGLARFTALIAEEGASVMEINHDRAFASPDVSTVMVHCVIETRDAEHAAVVLAHDVGEDVGFAPVRPFDRQAHIDIDHLV